MSWIRKHWDHEYIVSAEETIKATVCLRIVVYLKLTDIVQLQEYRDRRTPRSTVLPDASVSSEQWQDLDEQYGLDDMFDDAVEVSSQQTLEEEYAAYVNAPLSLKGTQMLPYWEVRHFIHIYLFYC
jgi:hypothetical protein